MTISPIATNTLVDQQLLNTIINELNGVSNKLVSSISPIYNTASNQVVNSYFGTFAIATNLQDASLVFGDAANQLKSTTLTFEFKKTFLTTPLIFVSISDLSSDKKDKYLPSFIVDKPNASGCNVIINMLKSESFPAGTLSFKVSIMAVGLAQLIS